MKPYTELELAQGWLMSVILVGLGGIVGLFSFQVVAVYSAAPILVVAMTAVLRFLKGR